MTAFVVFNPNSANGDTGRDWREIEDALERVFPLMSFFVTTAPTQAARMVRDALKDGHMEIVAVGGDGTINEALNGFFDHGAPVSPDAVLSFVHNGNTSAICRKFGLLPGWQAGVAHLKQARIHKADVGRVSCLSEDGLPVSRFFLGAASFGLGAEIALRLGRSRIARALGHDFAYWLHARAALLAWHGCHVRLMSGTQDEIAGIVNVSLSPSGGMFELAVTAGASRRTALKQLRKGSARHFRAARLTAAPTVETLGKVAVETDGETAGRLPATFDLYPAAINLRI